MASARVLAVVAVLVLAGCGALTGTSDREPYGVDEPVEPEPEELLPGLTEDEVTSADRLHAAHYDALEDEAYELQQSRTDRAENGSIELEIHSVRRAPADRTAVYASATFGNETGHVDDVVQEAVWYTNETPYVRTVTHSGEVTYDVGGGLHPVSSDPTPNVQLSRLYEAVETIEPTDDGRIELAATGVEVDRIFETASFQIVLSEEGYVERYELEGTSVRGDGVHTEETVALETLEDPELEEPDWLEEAEREAEEESE